MCNQYSPRGKFWASRRIQLPREASIFDRPIACPLDPDHPLQQIQPLLEAQSASIPSTYQHLPRGRISADGPSFRGKLRLWAVRSSAPWSPLILTIHLTRVDRPASFCHVVQSWPCDQASVGSFPSGPFDPRATCFNHSHPIRVTFQVVPSQPSISRMTRLLILAVRSFHRLDSFNHGHPTPFNLSRSSFPVFISTVHLSNSFHTHTHPHPACSLCPRRRLAVFGFRALAVMEINRHFLSPFFLFICSVHAHLVSCPITHFRNDSPVVLGFQQPHRLVVDASSFHRLNVHFTAIHPIIFFGFVIPSG